MGSAIFRNYLTSSIWIAPSGSAITASCWGGGGGGQDTDIEIPANGVGGDGGSYARKILTVVSGSSYIVKVGAGGPATSNGFTSPGGDSWFSGSTIVRAKGGNSAATNIGDVTYTGGAAGIGGGGGAGSTGNGGGGGGLTGGTGTAVSGGNGGTTPGTNANGRTGSLYGGGGSGGATTGITDYGGAAGAEGLVILSYPGSSSLEQFISTTTWVCPQGVSFVTASCWGGGGSGGDADVRASATDGRAGGAGGGGAFARKVVPVMPGTSYTVTVGGPNQDSWFVSTTTVLARSGSNGQSATCGPTICTGGTGRAGGSAAGSIGDITYSGGSGGSTGGGGGGAAGLINTGSNGASGGGGGIGGGPYAGKGGDGDIGLDQNGLPGGYFGAGGGGGPLFDNGDGTFSANSGGAGAQGLVILEYTPIIQSAVAGAFFSIL